ncbi:MAG: 1-deoxy-D-xylulose-5-phosphate synthase [Candidatus Eiseniibacteriota bacterium]
MERLLDGINSPADLKRIPEPELPRLAQEIRDEMVRVVCETGGHLGSGLGSVELAIAIHYVFDSPRDRLIWDVGHQAYPHKLLTGRRDRFDTVRTFGGISGFPVRTESPHDHYGTAHASTAIAAAMGLAVSRDLSDRDNHVIAVVGDGAMTGGLSYEGLNKTGDLGTRLLVVLNDNEMSISHNVGAISKYLTRISSTGVYRRFEADVWELLGKLPKGSTARVLAHNMKESLKNLVLPNLLFEELGFQYYGPIDGHDVHALVKILRQLKTMSGPVLLHTLTRKGKGVSFAEQHAEKCHGVSKIDPQTGKSLKKSSSIPSYTQIFGQTAIDLGRLDPRVVAITAAMPTGTGLSEFQKVFPNRFYDVGIAEACAIEFAGGLAADGKRPICAIYSTFLQRAYDQIIHDLALQRLPVILAIDRAGLVGEDGPTHHGVFDIAYLRTVPNVSLLAPRDECELRRMLYTALGHEDGPVAVRYPRGTAVGVPLDEDWVPIEWGTAEIVRSGADVALVAIGSMVRLAEEAADRLAAHGVEATVVNARFVKPLDASRLAAVACEVPLVVTLEEGQLQGGFGSAVLESLADQEILTPVRRIGLPDGFVQHGARDRLLELVGLTPEAVAGRVHDWVAALDGSAAGAASAAGAGGGRRGATGSAAALATPRPRA